MIVIFEFPRTSDFVVEFHTAPTSLPMSQRQHIYNLYYLGLIQEGTAAAGARNLFFLSSLSSFSPRPDELGRLWQNLVDLFLACGKLVGSVRGYVPIANLSDQKTNHQQSHVATFTCHKLRNKPPTSKPIKVNTIVNLLYCFLACIRLFCGRSSNAAGLVSQLLCICCFLASF